MEETDRRRTIQENYNQEHGIVPKTIVKPVDDLEKTVRSIVGSDASDSEQVLHLDGLTDSAEIQRLIEQTKKEMLTKASEHAFEDAARLRDEMLDLQKLLLVVS